MNQPTPPPSDAIAQAFIECAADWQTRGGRDFADEVYLRAREIAAQPGEGERSSGAELMASFEDADWNQIRESMEQAVISACTALLAHTEAAGMTLEHEGIAIQIGAISYEGAKS